MNCRAGVLALAACAATPSLATAAEDARILAGGTGVAYHAGDVPSELGAGWMGLVVRDGTWHLAPATFRKTPMTDIMDEPGQQTGVSLDAVPADSLVYLNLPELAAGKVDTPDLRLSDARPTFEAATTMTIPFKGHTWRLEVRRGELMLSEGRAAMSLGPVIDVPDSGTRTAMLWAGDLDRDGRLDFVFEEQANNASTLCIWLSSRAVAGRLVGKASCLHAIGC